MGLRWFHFFKKDNPHQDTKVVEEEQAKNKDENEDEDLSNEKEQMLIAHWG